MHVYFLSYCLFSFAGSPFDRNGKSSFRLAPRVFRGREGKIKKSVTERKRERESETERKIDRERELRREKERERERKRER